jgi:cell wall-associated NlpC family hydrolase
VPTRRALLGAAVLAALSCGTATAAPFDPIPLPAPAPIAAPAVPSPAPIAAPDPVRPAQTAAGRRLSTARARLDRTAAELARARNAAQASTGAARERAESVERRLEGRKRGLLAREAQLARESVLAARRRTARAAARARALARERAEAAPAPVSVAPAAPGMTSTTTLGPSSYRVDPYLNSPGSQYAQARVQTTLLQATVPVAQGGLAAQLDQYLQGKGSPLAGLGATFVEQSDRVGLDPRLLVAIAGAETSFGTYGPSQTIHNPFGMGPGFNYPTWADAIAGAARNLGGSLYKGAGKVTIAQIQGTWAPVGASNDPGNLNSEWAQNVSHFYRELGGDPTQPVFSGAGTQLQAAVPVAAGVPGATQGTLAPPVAYGAAQPVAGGGSGVGPLAAQDALRFLGTPYVWGGEDPSGFDCSGLVQYVYAQRGVTIPRVAEDQAAVGIPVTPQQLQAGDAIFFADSSGYIGHEGMYLGGGQFIHAPRTGDVVKISSLYDDYYARRYAGARRY